MKKLSIFYILIVILCSLRAFQLYLSSTNELRSVEGHSWLPSKKINRPSIDKYQQKNDSITIGNESNNLFYFVQVTDLHLSRFRPKGHTHHFLHFIQSILPIIKPKFVVVTGDLTDAKDKKRVTSQQYVDEWDIYQKSIQEKVNVDWYDMRGNHDCFDLPSWKSRVNYYRTHGHSANMVEEGKGIYSWQLNQPMGDYQFVAIDACPKRGPSRPLNFFGYLTSKTMDQLERALTYKEFNHTFVFSHYPTSTMVFGVSKKGKTFRDLASHYSAYFCGHLHKLIAGLGDVLKSYDPVTKSLELELGDLKEHGLYRIIAVDHDLISFVDLQLPMDQIPKKAPVNEHGLVQPIKNDQIIWPSQIHPNPSILVTNPKDARFSIPSKEPLWRIKSSTHIRFLVFAKNPEKLNIDISIDGAPHPHAPQFVGDDVNPLWVAAWDPSLFEDRKTHRLLIKVSSLDGNSTISETPFRVDSHRIKINGGSGEFIIKSKMATVLQCISLFTIYGVLLLLISPTFFLRKNVKNKQRVNQLLLRIHTLDHQPNKSPYLKFKKQILIWSFRFLKLSQDRPFVWHLTFGYILALLTLPWFRANFIPSAETDAEKYGIFYMWGMVFADEWVPIADTWMLAAEQIVFDVFVCFVLFTWRGTHATDYTCRNLKHSNNSSSNNSNSNTVSLKSRRQMNEKPWFKSIEALYWLWRSSELVALASFYGGIWPTLVQNMNVYWMLFIGGNLAWGKNGLFIKKQKKYASSVEGCLHCQRVEVEKKMIQTEVEGDAVVLQYLSSASVNGNTLTQEEEQQKMPFISASQSSGSSSSSSSTPFDGMIQVKSRKKQLKN